MQVERPPIFCGSARLALRPDVQRHEFFREFAERSHRARRPTLLDGIRPSFGGAEQRLGLRSRLVRRQSAVLADVEAP